MAGLSVIFRAVDEISSRFDAMVSAGTRALDSFDRIEAAADSSYDVISELPAPQMPWSGRQLLQITGPTG